MQSNARIDRGRVEKWKPAKRRQVCDYLAWWRDPQKRLTNFQPYKDSHGNEIHPLGLYHRNPWMAFLYEADARQIAQESGRYEWSRGKPFCDLARTEAVSITESRFLDQVAIEWGRVDTDAPGFSEAFRVNLTMQDKDLLREVKDFIAQQRTANGIQKRHQTDRSRLVESGVPWQGLELFDQSFVLGETLDEAERKRVDRSLEAFREVRLATDFSKNLSGTRD